MLVIVLVVVATSVGAEVLNVEDSMEAPVTLAMELTSVEGARVEVAEFSVPANALTGAVTVFTTGKDETVVVSESTVTGTELMVAATEFRTGDVTALAIGSNAEGRVARVPVIEFTTGSDVTVLVNVLSVAGTLAVIELTTGNELTVFVRLSTVVGAVPTTVVMVEPTTDVGAVS